ncbi:MAG: hypothetical protein PHV34_05105 [Verrucomicrobiae bacterium]|nr:hypothetical protein [Verrucomicrobiae bacterium]
MDAAPQASAPRRADVFAIGLLLLAALWLPPLPAAWRESLENFGWFGREWARGCRWDYALVPLLAVWALRLAWVDRPAWRDAGLDFRHFAAAARYLLWPTLAGAAALLLIGWSCDSIHITARFWKRFLLNSAILQQAMLQLFFHRQLVPWTGAGRRTAWMVTIYFAILHAPNPGLMLGTLIGMYFWARCYQKHPNLYALAISQSFLSALLMHTMPKAMLPSVSVGLRFVEKAGWPLSGY